jgi:DNA topoisomerase I
VSPDQPGIRRRRHGRGFSYVGVDGTAVRDKAVLTRIRKLAIPPAWTDVWICPVEDGHLQAIGTDAAGRRQYRYHDRWQERRQRQKFDRMLEFARLLPSVRSRVEQDLRRPHPDRERVLAAAVRLLDLGFFRIGSEAYEERNGSFGLATIKRHHVRVHGDTLSFDYVAKGGKRRIQEVIDQDVARLVRSLKARRGGGEDLLAVKEGGAWRDVRSHDVNAYLRTITDGMFTAKDFRTWNATVLAAVALAVSGRVAGSATGRKRAVSRAIKEVAHYLGNTPAVCRASYIDPRVFDAYRGGLVIGRPLQEAADGEEGELPIHHRAVEEAVLDLIDARERAPGVERVAA